MAVEHRFMDMMGELHEARLTLEAARAEAERLRMTDSGGTSGGVNRDTVADMIAASEARTATHIERVVGEVRTIAAEVRGDLQSKPSTISLFAGLAGTALAVIAAVLTALAYGGDQFGQGRDIEAAIGAAAKSAVAAQVQSQPTAEPQKPSSPQPVQNANPPAAGGD